MNSRHGKSIDNIVVHHRKIRNAIQSVRHAGFWMESGTMEVEGKLWSFRFQQLKRKPKQQKVKSVE